jgi:hypothetical protein
MMEGKQRKGEKEEIFSETIFGASFIKLFTLEIYL